MPDPQQPDYDALAKQAGGIDYDALAAQAQAGEDKPPSVPPSMWDRLKSAAYQASPLPLFEKQNLPTTMGAVAGAATGGLAAVPVAGATAMLTSAAQGGTPQQNVAQGLLNAGGEAAGPVLKAGEAVAPRLMQSAVKPVGDAAWSVLKSIKAGEAVPPLVKTLLDEGISVSRTGVARLSDLLGKANQAVSDAIAPMTGTIDKKTAAAYVLPTANKIAQSDNPDLGAVADGVTKFLNHPVYQGALTPQEAQAMKVGTYKRIADNYGELGSASVETSKAIARGLKEEIEQLAMQQGRGNVREMNGRVGQLMEALDAVAHRVNVQGNSNPVGLAALTHAKTAFLSAMIDRSPAVKSLLARGLYQSAGVAAGVTPTLLRSLVMATAQTPDEDIPQP